MFNSLRIFSIISLSVIVLIAILSGIFMRGIISDELQEQIVVSADNVAQGYINGVWVRYNDVIVPLASSNPSALRNNASAQALAVDSDRYFKKLKIVRANIYNADGRLLITSNANNSNSLSGNDSSPDSLFVSKYFSSTKSSSQLLEEKELKNNRQATLLQVVIPIRIGESAGVEGAVELVYDLSDPWAQISYYHIYGTIGFVAIFLAFLIVIFVSSKQTESIIAKQYEANIELAATAEAALAENQQKSQFLANISHELRTPLNAIIGFSDIIKTEVISAMENRKYHDYINDIHSSGVHLLSLINDILDYSKAEAGKLEMDMSEVNVTKLVQNSLRLVAPRAESGGVKLTDALPKEQITMITDSKKLKQILLNLLSNAVKFTPEDGEVKITSWHDLSTDSYYFEVKDSGIGIAPKDISRAMSPFGQIDSTLSRKYEGTGLGLPLTKKFVEIMGGTFTIESELDKGTTVIFSLPRELGESEGVIIKQTA